MRASHGVSVGLVCLLATSPSLGAERAVAPSPPAPRVASGGLAFGVEHGLKNGSVGEYYRAVSARALVASTRFADIGVTAGVEQSFSDGLYSHATASGGVVRVHTEEQRYLDLRTAISVSWGAPWRRRWMWGFGIDLGATGGFRDRGVFEQRANLVGLSPERPVRYVSPYAQMQLRLALCRCSSVRPMLAWTGRIIASHYGETIQSTGLDVGLAFVW